MTDTPSPGDDASALPELKDSGLTKSVPEPYGNYEEHYRQMLAAVNDGLASVNNDTRNKHIVKISDSSKIKDTLKMGDNDIKNVGEITADELNVGDSLKLPTGSP